MDEVLDADIAMKNLGVRSPWCGYVPF